MSTGGALIALGEKGVRLYAPNGKNLHRWSCPATHLTISDDGQHAIARSTKRGMLQTLHRLELTSLTATFWCEAEFAVAAPTFDGNVWYVAPDQGLGVDNFIEAIDAKASGFERILTGKVPFMWPIRLRRHLGQLYLWTSSLGASHLDIYALPSLEHVGSSTVEVPDFGRPRPGGSSEENMSRFLLAERLVGSETPPFTREPVYLIDSPGEDEPWGTCRIQDLKGTWERPFMVRAAAMVGSGRWVALLLRQPTYMGVVCFDLEAREPRWVHAFEGPAPHFIPGSHPLPSVRTGAGLRIEGKRLAAWDSVGEVVVLELETQRSQMHFRLLPW
ncbi:hypothetical protein DB31_2359 [Hyalangium minutum]|uniref:Uncharacterized protein n=1 Tax=Hyalangium minutum TaxID=394096 RepID=A0A085W8D4_9BACT|nr:hypothetical protein DB31_2359 [Hyalangium minutum]